MKTLEELKNDSRLIISEVEGNREDGFVNKEDAIEYVEKEKTSWGSNLIGWIEEKNNRYYPYFNIYE